MLFYIVDNLYNFGYTKIDYSIINDFLGENSESTRIRFENNNGERFVKDVTHPSFLRIDNFETYYIELRKMSLLRKLAEQGYPVEEKVYDPEETDPYVRDKKKKWLEQSSFDDILKIFKNDLSSLTDDYSSKNGRDSIKAGSDKFRDQKERWKQAPDYGLGYFSQYLTTITSGIRRKRFTLGSAPSGVGKTRVSIANLCYSFAPKYYDKKQGKFVQNPHGDKNAALYIGTEMELVEEIEPILVSYIADVPEQHILRGEYEEGEEERVDEAIRILHEEGNIYLEYIPDYDMVSLENLIESHVNQHGVGHVFFDYIHITTDLIAEYQGNSKSHMAIREDQVLANVGLKLKELARKYNISIDTWTQVNADAKDERNRDANVIRGAKSLADKADFCFIASRITEKEKRLLEPVIRQQFGKPEPNICLSVYKNRGGEYKDVKIWLYVDYATMRTEDLFVTDYEYRKIEMQKTYSCVDEDRVIAKTNKEDIKKIIKARQEMAEAVRFMQEEEEKKKQEEKVEEIENEELNEETQDEKVNEEQQEVEETKEESNEDEMVYEKIEKDKDPIPKIKMPDIHLSKEEFEIIKETIIMPKANPPTDLLKPEKQIEPIIDKTEDDDFEFKVDKSKIPKSKVEITKQTVPRKKRKYNTGRRPTKRKP